MINIKADNETEKSFDLEVEMKGTQGVLTVELIATFDDIYKTNPDIFEKALLHSQYTKDHT